MFRQTILSRATEWVWAGDDSQQVPVTSQDEVGTRQDGFNLMVRGLDERERMRDLFGVLDYRVIRV